MRKKRIKNSELLIIILFTNPITTWALTDNFWLSILFTLISLIIGVLIKYTIRINYCLFYYINILFVVFLFLSAELIFNTNYTNYIIKDLYSLKKNYYFNKSFLNEEFEDKEFIVKYITNSQGYRIERHIDPEKEFSKCDWLFVGDSYTQGAQVNYDKLFSSKLFEKNPNKVIINSGISGFGLPEEYYYYKNSGKKLNPKKVFLQICNFNDFMKVNKKEYGFSEYLMQKSNFARWLLWDFKYENPTELPLGRWTEPFFKTKKNNELYNIFYKPSSELKRRDSIKILEYIEKFKKETLKNNSDLVIILIPTKEQISSKYLNEVTSNFNISKEQLDMDKPNLMVKNICDSLNIKLIDLLKPFKSAETFPFYDFDEHLNEFGHKLVAEEIDKFLKQNDSLPLPIPIGNQFIGNRYPNQINIKGDILYQSYRVDNMELLIGDSLLKKKSRITFNKIHESHPNFSKELNKICFTEGDQSKFQTNVYISDLDGYNRECITPDPNVFGAIPWFSPNGEKITYAEFSVDSLGNYSLPQIVIKNIKSGKKEIITSNTYESWRPVFSPDGNQLIYISKKDFNQFDIYHYNLITKKEVRLTNTPYNEWDPNYSHDGSQIVYTGHYSGNWDLFRYDLKSSSNTRLTFTLGDEWDPAFTYDDQKILYAADYLTQNGLYYIENKKSN